MSRLRCYFNCAGYTDQLLFQLWLVLLFFCHLVLVTAQLTSGVRSASFSHSSGLFLNQLSFSVS